MIRRNADRLVVEGPVTLDTVPELAAGLEAQLGTGDAVVDFGGVTDVDSSAVALVLEWRRQAEVRGVSLRVANAPEALQNLARLYGVLELLPLAR
ncbi:MAG TPA: STAS domain-containing protein [Burkholderiales bacterium]